MCVCVSVCLSVHEDISGTTRAIFTNFSVHVACGRGVARSSSGRVTKSQGKGQFWGLSGSFKSIGNLHCRRRYHVCCKRDHSIANNVIMSCSRRDHSVCQASANRNSENYERRRCGLSDGKGDGSTKRWRCLISTIALLNIFYLWLT